MHRVAVSERRAAFVSEITDGVVGVGAVLLGLVCAKSAACIGQAIQSVVAERAACGKEVIGDGETFRRK